jgi:hypothetical protein
MPAGGCAIIYLSERFELDIENKGNPFTVQHASAVHFARRKLQRSVAFIGKMTEALKRRPKGF